MRAGAVERGVRPPPLRRAGEHTAAIRAAIEGLRPEESRWIAACDGETARETQVRAATIALRLWGKGGYRTAQERTDQGDLGVRVWRT